MFHWMDADRPVVAIVDDDDEFRGLLAEALVRRGMRVVEARTAAEGDLLIAVEAPALAIIDGLLPDTSGIEWISRRRRLGDATRMAFVSAYWRDIGSYERLARDLGVELVLYKPIDPDTIAERVYALLDSGPPSHDPLSDKLATLRADYADRLPGQLDDAELAVRAAMSSGSPETISAATAMAHKLRGTAGSYGFVEVSHAFARVEDALRALDPSQGPEVARDVQNQIEAAIRQARAASPSASLSRGAPPSATGMRPGRVLVVDDDPDFLRLVAAVATRSNVEVIPALTAEEALAIARTLPIDAAILDVNLADQPSFPVARQLRFIPGREGLPIAFASADSSIETRAAAAHAGAVRFLQKPIDPELLLDLAGELVSLARRNRARVLIVDDDPDFAVHAAAVLSGAGVETRVAVDADAAVAELDAFRPELVLADVFLSGISGLDLCRTIRLSPRWDEVPVILTTTKPGRDTLIEGFQAGCDDYLTKPIVPEELLARVRVRLDRAHLLRRASEIDPTTGLMVRRAFARTLNAALHDARRHGRVITVALIDLDRFKLVNDSQGHLAGDRVLEGVGALMRRSFRVYDVVGRWGGEELVVAFPGEPRGVGAAVVERLLAETAALVFEGTNGRFSITFTAGVASFPDDGTNVEAIMAVADRRLYLGKSAGRARVVKDG